MRAFAAWLRELFDFFSAPEIDYEHKPQTYPELRSKDEEA